MSFDPIELEVLWQSLIATVNEQARALQRAAFSPIVREAGDLANAVFDQRGRMVAQAVTGTPGHINSLARAASAILDEYPPPSLDRGDVLITNDPYKTAGQLLDVTVLYPVFRNGRVIAFFGSTIHHTDVGGYGIGAGARDVFEEGLWIPICKLMKAGERNDDVWKFILSNVRQPDHMAGDLHAQMASGEVGAQRLQSLCDAPRSRRHRGARRRDHRAAARPATRATIRELPAGRYHGAGRARPRRRQPRSTSSAPSPSIPSSARSSSTTPVRRAPARSASTSSRTTRTPTPRSRCARCSTPSCPTTTAAWRRSRSMAPVGSIVNAVSPQPCTARHVVGMFLPNALLKALAQIKPEQAMAEGSGAVWTMQVIGQPRRRPAVHHGDVHLRRRRRCARRRSRACRACSYPTGVAAVPVEVVEASAPIRFHPQVVACRQRRRTAAQTGGLGQTIEFTRRHRRGRGSSTRSPRGWRYRRRASSEAARAPPARSRSTASRSDAGTHHAAAGRPVRLDLPAVAGTAHGRRRQRQLDA